MHPNFARFFDGIDDRLNTGVGATKGSSNNVSCYAWIKQDVEDAEGTIIGCSDTAGGEGAFGRFQIRSFFTNTPPRTLVITLRGNSNFTFRTVNTVMPFAWEGVPVFIAAVNDVANDRARFFYGRTSREIIEVPIADFITATTAIAFSPLISALTLHIGVENNNVFGFSDFWHGTIDAVGIEFDTVLSLAQLKQRALCGLGHAAQYFWPINGTDPEPGIVSITGTTVVEGLCEEFAPIPLLSVKYGIWASIAEQQAGGGGGGSDGGAPPGGGGLLGELDICTQLV